MVKKEFGPEAVILSARSIKKDKGIYRFLSRPGVEVTAAIDSNYSILDENNTYNDLSPDLYMGSDVEPTRNNPGIDRLNEKKGILNKFHRELRILKNRREPEISQDSVSSTDNFLLMSLRKKLLSQGIEEDTIKKLMQRMAKGLKGLAIGNEGIGSSLAQALDAVGVKANPIGKKGERRKIVTLIGTTGVGKTTTVAKIAAFHLFEMEERVAMISLDDNRIGAVEQLKAYARIMGIQLEFASNHKELKKAVRGLMRNDLILIDTPGMSQKNDNELNKLKSLLGKIAPMEAHLLLSATSKYEDVQDVVDRFSLISFDRMIFTKIDESSTFGSLLNAAIRTMTPISYLTNGQQVPEDLEPVSLRKIADMLLEGWTWGRDNRDLFSQESRGEYKQAVGSLGFKDYYIYNGRSDILHYPG